MSTRDEFEDEFEDEDEDEDEESGELVLLFTLAGTAILEEDGEAVWFSDDDDDFAEAFGNEFLDPDQDARKILVYLVKEGILEENEKEVVEIQEEEPDEDTESDSVTEPPSQH